MGEEHTAKGSIDQSTQKKKSKLWIHPIGIQFLWLITLLVSGLGLTICLL